RKLDQVVARDDKELVLVVEGHSKRHAFRCDKRKVASIRVEDLNAFHVADVNTPVPIHRDRIRRTKLARFIAIAAEAIHKLPITPELEDAIVESTECVDIARAINRYSHRQL